MWRLNDPKKVLFLLWLLFFNNLFFFNLGHGHEDVVSEEMQRQRPTISERLRSVYALLGTASSPFPVRSCWDRVRGVISEAQARLFRPNLDFRGGEQMMMDDGEVGTGEKVKEAVARSVEKGKETMEDSAKSAVKMATEAVEKTKDKVKRTLSDHGDDQHYRGEL